MTATFETKKVSVIKLQSTLNDIFKEDQKSLTALLGIISKFKNSQAMKEYLDAANLTYEQLTSYEYFKDGLEFKTFTKADGTTYDTIARKQKDGTYKPSKWSFWLIMNAARKVRKEELKKMMKVKEESLEAIEAEEAKAEKKTKKAK